MEENASLKIVPQDWDDFALGNPSKLRSRIGFEFHSDLSSEHFFLLLG